MIILKLQGGLGNQMFQYALAKRIQFETERPIILDISDFKYDKQRNFSLGNFELNDNVRVDDSGKYNFFYDQRINPFIKLGNKLAPNLMFKAFGRLNIFMWEYIGYKDIRPNIKKQCIMLHGLWQSADYFSTVPDLIRTEFSVKIPLKNKNALLYNDIITTNSVCVHIRRGDFLASTNKLCNCKNEYYFNAISLMNSNLVNPKYFVFSDDITETKKCFDFGSNNVVFVDQKNPDFEELRLMYSCKHFIIANSTFSWWASFLSQNQEKIIVAPKRWYDDDRDISRLISNDWIILPNH